MNRPAHDLFQRGRPLVRPRFLSVVAFVVSHVVALSTTSTSTSHPFDVGMPVPSVSAASLHVGGAVGDEE